VLDRTTTGRRGWGQLPATRRNGRFGYSLAAETHAFGLCLELVELPVQGDLSGELLLLPRVMAKEVLDFCSASSEQAVALCCEVAQGWECSRKAGTELVLEVARAGEGRQRRRNAQSEALAKFKAAKIRNASEEVLL